MLVVGAVKWKGRGREGGLDEHGNIGHNFTKHNNYINVHHISSLLYVHLKKYIS